MKFYISAAMMLFAVVFAATADAAYRQTVLASKLARGEEHVVLAVGGDSTGNEDWEWVYQTAKNLGDKFDYNVDYYLYETGKPGNWAKPKRIFSGSSTRTLVVYNCSVSGAPHQYLTSEGRSIGTLFPEKPDLFITSYGYNSQAKSNYGKMLLETIDAVRTTYPGVDVAVTAQPPKAAGDPDSLPSFERGLSIRLLAIEQRFHLIDVVNAFRSGSNLISEDKIHPNKAGQVKWTEEATRVIAGS